MTDEPQEDDFTAAGDAVYETLLTRLGEANPQPRLDATRRAVELLGDPHRGLRRQVDTRREPPRAVVHDLDGETDLLVVESALEAGVAQAQLLRSDALDPKRGVPRAKLAGLGEGSVGKLTRGQGEELLVDRIERHVALRSLGAILLEA